MTGQAKRLLSRGYLFIASLCLKKAAKFLLHYIRRRKGKPSVLYLRISFRTLNPGCTSETAAICFFFLVAKVTTSCASRIPFPFSGHSSLTGEAFQFAFLATKGWASSCHKPSALSNHLEWFWGCPGFLVGENLLRVLLNNRTYRLSFDGVKEGPGQGTQCRRPVFFDVMNAFSIQATGGFKGNCIYFMFHQGRTPWR